MNLVWFGLWWVARTVGSPATVEPELCLRGGQVVDPVAHTVVAADVRIAGSKVQQVKAGACRKDSLDVQGAFVLPGFVDAHVHSWGNPSPVAEADDEEWGDEKNAQRMLQAGVVGFLSMTGEPEDLALRDRVRASPAHAQIVLASPTGSYENGDRQARARIRAMAATKPDFIKLFAGGPQLATMMDEAKTMRLPTVVHIASWPDALVAIEAGATAITHLEDEVVIPDNVVQAMLKHKTVSIPTMAVQCDMAMLAQPAAPEAAWLRDPLLARVAGKRVLAQYTKPEAWSARTRRTIEWQSAGCKANDFASIKKLVKAGVPIVAGSDTGNLGTFQGYSLHREMHLLVQAGLSVWQALAAGTTSASRFLGLPYGVRVGDEASLVVLDRSPLADIRNTTTIRHVIRHGRLVPRGPAVLPR
ncbi:MAG: amidohydrolase family protein [Deltaproteobacteria bacterium]|nr:amidohydrolase family protein [Deltaproteobacteria bacterium]